MRRHRNNFWERLLPSLVVSVMTGLACISGISLFFSLVIYYFMSDMSAVGIFSAVSIIAGSFTGAYIFGKHRRRKGLIEGAIYGISLYFALSAVGIILGSGLAGAMKLILLLISGAAGGVSGVNSPRPRKLM